MSKAIRDFITNVKIGESGHVTVSEAEQVKLGKAITEILETAADEGRRIATGKEERSLIGSIKDLAGRARQIVGGVVNQVRDKVQGLYDPDLPNPYAGLDISDWAENYSEMVAATEITDAIEESILDAMIDQGVEQVSWIANPDACKKCQENAEASPLPIGTEFPSGDTEPPAHPNCRCNLVPADDAPEAMLAKKYPGTEFDFDGIDPEIAAQIADQLNILFEDYPEVAESIAYVGTGEGVPYDFQSSFDRGAAMLTTKYYPGDGMTAMFFNPEIFVSAEAMEDMFAEAAVKDWLAGDYTVESLVGHEFGHSLYYYLDAQGDESFLGFIGDGGEGSVGTMIDDFMTINKREGSQVSGYAATDPREAWAEAFSTLYHGEPGPYAQKMSTLLDQVFPGDNWQKMKPSELTPEQWQQWNQFVDTYIDMRRS